VDILALKLRDEVRWVPWMFGERGRLDNVRWIINWRKREAKLTAEGKMYITLCFGLRVQYCPWAFLSLIETIDTL